MEFRMFAWRGRITVVSGGMNLVLFAAKTTRITGE